MHAEPHSIHLATTISVAKPFVSKIAIEKEGLPRGSPAGLGAGGPEFKSRRPDQKHLVCFSLAYGMCSSLKSRLWKSTRQEV